MRRLESPRGRTATFNYLNINIMEKKLDLFTVLLPDDEWSLSLSMLDAIEPYSSKVQSWDRRGWEDGVDFSIPSNKKIFGSMLGFSRRDAVKRMWGTA